MSFLYRFENINNYQYLKYLHKMVYKSVTFTIKSSVMSAALCLPFCMMLTPASRDTLTRFIFPCLISFVSCKTSLNTVAMRNITWSLSHYSASLFSCVICFACSLGTISDSFSIRLLTSPKIFWEVSPLFQNLIILFE